ncbi:MAG TPA: hypothetical protein PLW10_00220 [Myxococcota bacterium]|nr:hypothetical protein [Myxococcota bacterium]
MDLDGVGSGIRGRALLLVLAAIPIAAWSGPSGAAGNAPASSSEERAIDPPEPSPPPRVALKWTAGLDVSRGDYGLDQPTTLYYVPLGVTGDLGRFRARLILPLLASDGPVRIDPGSGTTGRTGTDSDVTVGLGQMQVSAGYLVDPLFEGMPWVELTGRLTLPTETSEALGTGDVAFAAQIDLFERIGLVTPFVSLGRKWYDSAGLRDRFYTSLGASIAFGERTSAGLAWDWLESTSNAAADAHDLVPFFSFDVTSATNLAPYVVIGLSEGSPDWGLGVTVSVRR